MSIQSQFFSNIKRSSDRAAVRTTVVDEDFQTSLGGKWSDYEALGATPKTWNQVSIDNWSTAFPSKIKLTILKLKEFFN